MNSDDKRRILDNILETAPETYRQVFGPLDRIKSGETNLAENYGQAQNSQLIDDYNKRYQSLFQFAGDRATFRQKELAANKLEEMKEPLREEIKKIVYRGTKSEVSAMETVSKIEDIDFRKELKERIVIWIGEVHDLEAHQNYRLKLSGSGLFGSDGRMIKLNIPKIEAYDPKSEITPQPAAVPEEPVVKTEAITTPVLSAESSAQIEEEGIRPADDSITVDTVTPEPIQQVREVPEQRDGSGRIAEIRRSFGGNAEQPAEIAEPVPAPKEPVESQVEDEDNEAVGDFTVSSTLDGQPILWPKQKEEEKKVRDRTPNILNRVKYLLGIQEFTADKIAKVEQEK